MSTSGPSYTLIDFFVTKTDNGDNSLWQGEDPVAVFGEYEIHADSTFGKVGNFEISNAGLESLFGEIFDDGSDVEEIVNAALAEGGGELRGPIDYIVTTLWKHWYEKCGSWEFPEEVDFFSEYVGVIENLDTILSGVEKGLVKKNGS